MYTRKNLCFPTFHSTSTTSSPSERATLSAAARIRSKFTWRLPGHRRYQVHPNRRQQKSGLAPTHRCDRFRVNLEYIPAPRQKQGTPAALIGYNRPARIHRRSGSKSWATSSGPLRIHRTCPGQPPKPSEKPAKKGLRQANSHGVTFCLTLAAAPHRTISGAIFYPRCFALCHRRSRRLSALCFASVSTSPEPFSLLSLLSF
jgi:hypothetical protein